MFLGDDDVNIHELSESELRTYANESVGVQEIIDVYRRDRYATFRSDVEIQEHDAEESRWVNEVATEKELHRWWYQLAIQSQIIQASQTLYETMPGAFGDDGVLYTAYFSAMSQCATERGYPNLVLVNPPPAEDERLRSEHGIDFGFGYYDRLKPDFGISLDEYFSVRHECANLASHYPTLEEAERDRLLNLRNEHYWQEIKDFLLKNPDIIVPRLDPSDCTAEFIAECAGSVNDGA